MSRRLVLLLPLLACGSVSLGMGTNRRAQDELSAFEKCRLVTAVDLVDSKAPFFGDYAVTKEDRPAAAKLDLSSNPVARKYRTTLRLNVKKGPNFAGHYRVVIWGCGTSCVMFAVVNLKSGRVITPPGFGDVSGVFFVADDFLSQESDADSSGLVRYNAASKLLVVIGDLDEDESREGAFYFVLEGEELRLVHKTPVSKNCESLKGGKH